jgi:hypothetical protein
MKRIRQQEELGIWWLEECYLLTRCAQESVKLSMMISCRHSFVGNVKWCPGCCTFKVLPPGDGEW